jgi:hypothetical protein
MDTETEQQQNDDNYGRQGLHDHVIDVVQPTGSIALGAAKVKTGKAHKAGGINKRKCVSEDLGEAKNTKKEEQRSSLLTIPEEVEYASCDAGKVYGQHGWEVGNDLAIIRQSERLPKCLIVSFVRDKS